MPTGWRPSDVADRYPVDDVTDVYHFEKYNTRLSGILLGWSWFQLWVLLGFTMLLFFNFASIGFPMVLVYGLFIFISIFSLTATMDRAGYAVIGEGLRTILGLWILYDQQGSWFGMTVEGISLIVIVYLMISFTMVLYFDRSGALIVTGASLNHSSE